MKKSCLLLLSILAVLYSFAGDNFPFPKKGNISKLSSVSPTVTPSVSITSSDTIICVSGYIAAVSFTAYPVNGGANPYYLWKKNGDTVLQGYNSDIYVCNSYHDGDAVTCTMTSSIFGAFPAKVTSDAITLTVNNSKDTTVAACTSFYFRNAYGPYTTSGVYAIPISNGSGCDSVIYLNLTIGRPAKPTITVANTEICSFAGSTASYSLTNPDNSYYHKWIAPIGPRIIGQSSVVSGQGTSTAQLSFTSLLANRLLYVQAYDSNTVTGCVSDIDSLLLTMTVPALDSILPISGLSSLCTSQLTGLTYTANPGLNSTDITDYTWSISPATAGDIIIGQGTNSVTVNLNTTSVSYSIKVAANSACGTRAARGLNVSRQGAPATPTLILQSFNPNVPAVTSVCESESYTYRIRVNAGTTSYNWSLLDGSSATIEHLSSGATDTAVRVTFSSGFTSDSLMVSATNSCGTSLTRKIKIRINSSLPPAVATLSGDNTPCNGSLYNYTATANAPTAAQATLGSFRWYLPANATISSSNADSSSVYILFGSSFTNGSITVRTQSSCGIINSSFKTMVIKHSTPGMKAIGGTLTPCNNNSYLYTDTSLTPSNTQTPIAYYRWTRPAGTTISSSNSDSSAITISFGSTYRGGTIISYGVNACGLVGSSKTLQLKYLPPTPSSISSRSGSYNACIGDTISYTAVVPAPTISQQTAVRYRWVKPSTTTILSANADSSQIKLKFNTGYVGGTISVRGINVCEGLGSLKSQVLTHTGCPTGTRSAVNYTRVSGQTEPFNVSVYPNPSKSGFNLNVNSFDQSPVTVTIRDVQGKSISKLNVLPFENINVGNTLNPGTYLIETRQGNQTKTIRVVKY